MDRDFYISLMYKELKGELSDSEVETLKAFYNESSANRELRDEIQLSWMLSQEVGDVAEIDIDVQADLQKVKSTLNHTPQIEQQTAKIVPMWRRLVSIAAIAIPLMVGAFFLFQFLNQNKTITYQATNAIKEIQLEDGSTISLNQNSELEVAANFNETDRKVKLNGEAFFDVAKDQEKAFIIQVDEMKITVLGTSFNIKENENQLTVTVISGTVKVESETNSITLNKNEKAIYLKKNKELSQNSIYNKNDTSWKTGVFTFRSQPIGEVLYELENIFSKKITLEDSRIEKCGVSIVVNTTDFQTVLKKVADAVNCEIKKTDDDTFLLSGGECK